MSDQLYRAATYYVNDLGCSVVPITPGKKAPAIPWKIYQTEKPHTTHLVEWFHQGDFQLGIVCGAISGNLLVLDFETPGAYGDWCSRHQHLARTTRTVETGKGVHVYVRLPEARPGEKLIPDLVETRGEGHQVLAPPSLHPSGRSYRLRGEVREIAHTTWEEISRGEKWSSGGTAHISTKDAAAAVAFGTQAGARNDSIFNAAVVLRDTGAPQAQALAVLYTANDNNEPPLPREEIRRSVESAYSRPSRQSGPVSSSFDDIMAKLKTMRERQARGWLDNLDAGGAPLNFMSECRQLMKEGGALDELQIQEVIDEIMRNPPLAPRKRIELLRIWRVAHKQVRDAIAGKATDDEIAAAYKAQFYDKRLYSRARWYEWQKSGVWSDGADVRDEIWSTMCEFKEVDVKPSSHKRASVEECLQGRSYLGIHESKIDAWPQWVNLLNGVYDFESGALIPHAPTQYLTTQLPFDYDASADCPRWLSFLSEVLVDHRGEPDVDMVAFMRQAFGYSLTAWTKFELSFWLQGAGANGKSTLVHILSAMTGTASMALNLGMLERDQYQLAQLPGIRVVTCTESPVGLKVADSIIKTLVSGDVTTARLPYGKPFQLEPTCKIWWAMNNYPRVADTSEGFWRKVKVIPFLASFYGKERDTDLRGKLEAELPGIFVWALGGLRSLVTDGWQPCATIDGATETYRRSNDVEAVFVEECCLVGEKYEARSAQLYETYKQWCSDTGHRYKTSTRVAADWLRLGFEKDRDTKGVFYRGVGLRV